MCGQHTGTVKGLDIILGIVLSLLLRDNACAVASHHHGLQKLCLSVLQVPVMVFFRPNILSIRIKKRVCVLVRPYS